MTDIDWANPASPITAHFTVREATLLPSWGVLHAPSGAERANIVRTCQLLERVRDLLKEGIVVDCMIRPTFVECPGSPYHGQDYNAHVGGATHSAHIQGLACDFRSSGFRVPDGVRRMLEPYLEEFGCRMERKPGASWIHVDLYPPTISGGQRYFTP